MAYLYDGISLQNQRSSNMDSLLLKQRCINGENIYLAVVCDGVGSMEKGAFAASMAVRRLSQWFEQLSDTRRLGIRMRDYILELNADIFAMAKRDNFRTATTLSAIILDHEKYYIAHAGDSRIYGYCDGVLMQLTQDQVSGKKLASSIGGSENLTLFYNEGISAGMKFLLCSDGLYKRVLPDSLLDEMDRINHRNMKKRIEALVKKAIEKGEKDNVSLAVLIEER